ncbi:MAG: hypothetical protein BroJett029_00920 [Alphaproteobacteria bacterium]|nr:MAG: hypothetical protein BroJett029_00920 [Alphaproteobacteria bacterium]
MQDRDKQLPRRAERGEHRAADREARLARALRDNLARRKAQQRARAATQPAEPAVADTPSSTDG